MKSRIKRYITFLLSLAMIVGMLPQTLAYAEEITPNIATEQKGQVSFNTSDGGQLRVWTDNGSEYIISKDNNNVLLEYVVGETIHTEVQENQGYEVATYKVTTDGGSEKDMLAEKSTDIVVTETLQEATVEFTTVKAIETTESKKETKGSESTSKDTKEEGPKESIVPSTSVSSKVMSAMRSTDNGISLQTNVDPVITLNVYNLSGSLWKTFSYTVPSGTRFSVDNTGSVSLEDNTADLISAIETPEGGSCFLSLSDEDTETLTSILVEAEKSSKKVMYYNAGTTTALSTDFYVSSSMTLDVKFETDAMVDLIVNYNNGTINYLKIPYGTSPEASRPANPSKSGCIFDDWYNAETQDVFNWSDNLYKDTTVEALYDMDEILDEALNEDEADIPEKITDVDIKLGQWKNMPKNTVGSHTKWKATITGVGGSAENKKWARLLGLKGKTFYVQCVSPGKSRASYGTHHNATLWIYDASISESGIIRYKIRPTEAKGWKVGKGLSISNQGQKVYFQTRLQNTMMGKFKLRKVSTLPDVVKGNPNYSVAGATFTVYKGKLASGTDVSGKKTYGTLTTKADGTTDASKALTPGTYTVVETTPSEGHSKYPATENCTVDSEGRRLFNNIVVKCIVPDKDEEIPDDKIPTYDALNSPQMDPLNLAIRKFNKESGLQVNGGNGNFAVEYKFSYYYTKNMTEAQCKATQPDRVWYMRPDPVTGRLVFGADSLVASKSDPLWYNEKNEASIPIGSLTIQEVSDAGTGYLVENTIFRPTTGATINGNFVLFHINGDMALSPFLTVFHTTDSTNDIRRGDLKFVKVDNKSMDRLANVPFKITSETTGESHTIVTDINGQASTEASWATRDDSVNLGQSYDDGAFFTGYGPDSVVSDEDKANGVTWQTGYDNVMKYYPNATAKDKVGALPYDNYIVEEQRCAANEGKELLKFIVRVGEQHHKKTIDMGTLDNHEELSIYTIAKDAVSLTKEANASGEVKLIDTVHYAYNGRVGEKTYIAIATLMDKETGEPVLNSKGEKITGTKEFTPRAAIGEIDVPITFNGADVTTLEDGTFKSKDVVVFEKLYEKGADTEDENNVVTKHEDIEDEGQTVTLTSTEIKTTAMGKESNTNEVDAKKDATIVDIVRCNGLTKGKEYKLTGLLMDKETGEPLIVNDKQVTATKTFTATDSYMEVEVEFKFDASALAGKTTVVFEDLYQGEKKVATHADIEDISQSVNIVEIGTSASIIVKGDADAYVEKLGQATKDEANEGTEEDGEDEKPEEGTPDEGTTEEVETSKDEDGNLIVRLKEGQTSEKTTLIDIVKYKGLTPGKEYTLNGIIYNKEVKDFLKVNGANVENTIKFTPEKPDGEVEVAFVFDTRGLEGKDIVVYEYLKWEDRPIASHEDPEDEDQTIHFVDVKTTAMGKDTESDETQASEVTTIVDKVDLTNLTVGTKYKLDGHLMNATTGENIIVDGNPVVASKEFTASEKNMTVELEYTFNSKDLAGVTTVVFEDLYKDGTLIATHSDLTDEGQQVDIIDIGTRASDVESGGKEMTLGKNVKLLDIVDYTNLKVGEEYTMKGVIYDKETGKELIVNGKKVKASIKFKPVAKDGSVDVEFTLNTKAAQGKELVVFEGLYDKRGKKVASHEDIDDEGQTVKVPKSSGGNGTGSGKLVQTGESVVSLIFAIACIAVSLAMYLKLKRRTTAGDR